MPSLFEPLTLKSLHLPNRIAMAPLTRCRADADGIPHAGSQLYYGQRSTAALIVTEGTNVSSKSCSFERTPGIYTDAQVESWRNVTDTVHEAGGRIILQLWHCGRVGSDAILGGQAPLSPSGVNDDLDALQVWGLMANGRYARIAATPSREMSEAEIKEAVAEYRKGARNAMRAGFDGVEIHAANGYLPHQFMSATLNRRTDQYGGSVEKRLNFLLEVADAVVAEVEPSRVGIRISPYAAYNNVRDPDPDGTTIALARMLDEFDLAYLHLADTNAWAGAPDMPRLLSNVKPYFNGVLMGNGGITPEAAANLVQSGSMDLVAFGRPFLVNPDLPDRIRQNGPYNDPRSVGWYGGGDEGYTDYPSLHVG